MGHVREKESSRDLVAMPRVVDARRLESGACERAPSTSEDPLAPLVAEVLCGNPSAERALLGVLREPIRRLLLRRFGASADADDLLQDALLGVLAALPRFRRDSTVLTFSLRIAWKTSLAFRRRERRRKAREAGSTELASPFSPAADVPEDAAIFRRRHEALRALVATLSDAQAEALVLHVGLGLPLKDVAAASGAPVNTVRTRIRLALRSLRKRIESENRMLDLLQP